MISLQAPVLSLHIHDIEDWDKRVLLYSRKHNPVQCLQGPDQGNDTYARYDMVMAIGSQAEYTLPTASKTTEPFKRLEELYALSNHGWVFCHLNYDLKNATEDLKSSHEASLDFPDLFAFIPRCVITRQGNDVQFYGDPIITAQVQKDIIAIDQEYSKEEGIILDFPDRKDYIQSVNKVKEYIREGRIYEMNFCVPFTAQAEIKFPETVFMRLQEYAEAPFAAYYKHCDQYLLCASPERYFQSEDNYVRSQPIKGTASKGSETEKEKALLAASEKDQAEHVMIVDLVRNDIKRNSLAGSVVVEELMGIHSFKHVHHMISTIRGELIAGRSPFDALRDCFPMGSMTGAPKIEAMKVIEEMEIFRRGLYSGSIGYINPKGDMDFNVVIRSVLYNQRTQDLSCPVGGAIVQDSVAEEEWEECLLKLNSVQRILGDG